MNRTVIAISIAMAFSAIATSRADENGMVGLKDVIEKTVISNPEIEDKFHAFKASEQEQKVARGGYFPRADVLATFRSQEKLIPNINNTETPDRQTQLILKQMLFDGFVTKNEVSRLDHASHVRYYELQSTMQSIALDVAKAYIDVQRYRQLVSYAKDNYVAHKQLFDRIEDRVTAGVGRRVDLEQAGGRLALAEANLLTEATNLQNVSARYQRLTGELPPENLAPINLGKDGIGATPTEALQIAYKKNPDLMAAIETIVSTQSEVEGKRSKYLPRLDLQATTNLDTSNNGKNSTLAADVLQLTASFNLFNGFSDKANISQSAEKLNASQDLRDKACVDTRQNVVIAYNDISVLTDQLEYRNQHQLSIDKAREAYRDQFDIGQRTLLDLLDTENEYFQARRAFTNTDSDLTTAYARTYASQGILLEKLGVVRADLPELVQGDTSAYSVCDAVAPEPTYVEKVNLVTESKSIVVADSAQPAVVSVCASVNVTSRLNGWADAWRKKDTASYLSYYADTFRPEKGLTKAAWESQRKKRLALAGTIGLSLEGVQIASGDDNASATFVQNYTSGGFNDKVNKKLTYQSVGTLCQIVKEEIVPDSAIADTAPVAADAASTQVITRINAWSEAWQRGDIDGYLKFYSDNFKLDKLQTREEWIKNRTERVSAKQGIESVKLSNIKVKVNGDSAIADFTQDYKSAKFSDTTAKRLGLELQRVKGEWMIVSESNR